MPSFYFNNESPGSDTERPILKGDNVNQWFNPWKKIVGNYSNYSLLSPNHVLDGAPDANHVPGTGYFPHGLLMSLMFTGKFNPDPTFPLWTQTLGLGPRQEDGRFGPFRFHGILTVWHSTTASPFGHTEFPDDDYSWNLNNFYRGAVRSSLQTATLGHAIRSIDANQPGQPAGFGYFVPTQYHGLAGLDILDSAKLGQKEVTNPDILVSPYGHNQVLLWQGIPSAKAL